MTKKIVKVGDIECGANQLFLISGPCVIEDESIMMRTAEKLKEVTERMRIPLIFKSSYQKDNRSSLEYYTGPGLEKGLEILAKIKAQFGFPILSDVHYPDQIAAAAQSGRVINIKHGQFLAPDNMGKPAQKAVDSGNDQIILTERGYTFGYNDMVVDPRSFYFMRQTGFPVVFDITHSIRKYGIPSADPKGGNRPVMPTIARAGVAAGVDGVFIETHPDPARALCDAASQLSVYELEEFLKPLVELHEVEVKYREKILA